MKITKYVFKMFIAQVIIVILAVCGYAFEKPTHFEINKDIAKSNIGGF